jgi:hypothetical protein
MVEKGLEVILQPFVIIGFDILAKIFGSFHFSD